MIPRAAVHAAVKVSDREVRYIRADLVERLIEAGHIMRTAMHNMGHGDHWYEKWDAAVAELKEEK